MISKDFAFFHSLALIVFLFLFGWKKDPIVCALHLTPKPKTILRPTQTMVPCRHSLILLQLLKLEPLVSLQSMVQFHLVDALLALLDVMPARIGLDSAQVPLDQRSPNRNKHKLEKYVITSHAGNKKNPSRVGQASQTSFLPCEVPS